MAQGVPFRRWEWLESWWQQYGPEPGQERPSRELFVLAVLDARAHAAWPRPLVYRALRVARAGSCGFLGSGEVCSEYLSLLAADGQEETVARGLAKWLTESTKAKYQRPDGRSIVRSLGRVETHRPSPATIMRSPGCWIIWPTRATPSIAGRGMNCWRLALPGSWEEYLAMVSKSHRKQLRRLDRDFFRSGRACIHWVRDPDQFEQALDRSCRIASAPLEASRLARLLCFGAISRISSRGGVANAGLRRAADELAGARRPSRSRPNIIWPATASSTPISRASRRNRSNISRATCRIWRRFAGRSSAATVRLIFSAATSRINPIGERFRGRRSRPASSRRGMGPRIRQGIWAAGSTVWRQIRSGWQVTRQLITE